MFSPHILHQATSPMQSAANAEFSSLMHFSSSALSSAIYSSPSTLPYISSNISPSNFVSNASPVLMFTSISCSSSRSQYDFESDASTSPSKLFKENPSKSVSLNRSKMDLMAEALQNQREESQRALKTSVYPLKLRFNKNGSLDKRYSLARKCCARKAFKSHASRSVPVSRSKLDSIATSRQDQQVDNQQVLQMNMYHGELCITKKGSLDQRFTLARDSLVHKVSICSQNKLDLHCFSCQQWSTLNSDSRILSF